MQSLDLLGLQRDRRIAPTEADIRMMALGLCEFTNLLTKGKRLAEIAKLEAPLDAVSFLRQLPVWGLCVKELSLLAREWGYSPATGSTGFASKSFGHVACPLVSTFGRSCARLDQLDRSRVQHPYGAGAVRPQSPAPGFGEKYWSLSGFPSHSLESGGGAFLTVIFGQILAYSAFSDSHFSSPGSLSALMASTGHSGSQTPQSMHSSGWMTSMFSPS